MKLGLRMNGAPDVWATRRLLRDQQVQIVIGVVGGPARVRHAGPLACRRVGKAHRLLACYRITQLCGNTVMGTADFAEDSGAYREHGLFRRFVLHN